jgi:2-dehydro-3-deoxygalactonokinase
MYEAAFIAIDWGTTNRRIYAIDADGSVVATEGDDRGILAMAGGDFAGEVSAIRARLGDLPVVCAGMVGSGRGWATVPYVSCPADTNDLAGALHWIEPGRTAIVPGVSHVAAGRGDVMRGEEVQLLGAPLAGLAPEDALLCQPGTHCKWARMAGHAIAEFRTTMTGEMFALLCEHSLLRETIAGGDAGHGAAFQQGLYDAVERRLLGDLFRIRANALLGLRDPADAASYTSGLLIGSDVREQHLAADEVVHLLAIGSLAALYASAIDAYGAHAVVIDSHSAFVTGIAAIWSHAHAL